MASDPLRHYARHEQTYDKIQTTLETVRDTFVFADLGVQKSMLFDSSVFAVMSVQNNISILRDAFRIYNNSDTDMSEAFQGLNYGNNKLSYAQHNKEVIESQTGGEIIKRLITGDVWDAVDLMQTHLDGVSWVKAPFIAAMLGFEEVMCVDTNVAQMVPDDSVKSSDYSSAEEYREAVERVREEYPDLADETSTFMLQWVVFDANRGDGVARHEEWFEAMLPGSPFGRQTMISSF